MKEINKYNNIIFVCPKCRGKINYRDELLNCTNVVCEFSSGFPSLKNGKQILVDFDRSLLNKSILLSSNAQSVISRQKENTITKLLKSIVNGNGSKSRANVNFIVEKFKQQDIVPRILIVGGGKVGVGMEVLYKEFETSIYCFDIYDSSAVDFIADAHNLPFEDESFDVIITQAVLEHVFDPMMVVDELYRCLKSGGVVYAETPFLQHVHEGAYDFTRYTVLGHRILFKRFSEIDSGFIGGVGLTFLWSLEYFASALFRSRKIGKVFKLLFFWIKLFDLIVPERYNVDSACGAFFIGDKVEYENKNFIDGYKGAQR
jgi:SAM-dependent methyltransferase